MKVIVGLLKAVVGLLQFGIPLVLIIFGMLDLGKAVMAGKEDEMKSAQKLLIRRIIYAIAVFLVVTIVRFALGMIGRGSGSDWDKCWHATTAEDAKDWN